MISNQPVAGMHSSSPYQGTYMYLSLQPAQLVYDCQQGGDASKLVVGTKREARKEGSAVQLWVNECVCVCVCVHMCMFV